MIKTTSRIILLLTFCLFLVNWGGVGHRTISFKCPESFPASMDAFKVWNDSLSMHASDADNRKSADPNESPKHFLDVENYTEFNASGRIFSTYDSIVAKYGSSKAIKNGTLPWATQNTYNLLVNDFKALNWHKAMIDASDLGHYVADGHMPLHISANFDGYQTDNDGIHSRYESTMVGKYVTALSDYSGSTANYVSNVNKYIFNYIYTNHQYVDSVLLADNYAKSFDASYSTVYYTKLWSKTQFTTTLFKNASHALAELIYSAWVDAGSPPFRSTTFLNVVDSIHTPIVSVYPNPTTGIINFNTENIAKVEVFSISGELIRTYFQNEINLSNQTNGVYILNIFRNDGVLQKEKVVLAK